jgi:hypothetical protein
MTTRGLTRIVFLVSCVWIVATHRAAAANPASGTVTPAAGSKSYTGGPFSNNNQLNQAAGVPLVCVGDTAPCDDYALTVSIPGNDGNVYNLTVQVQWPNGDSDFDLTVEDGSGNIVGQSATSSDPEIVTFAAVPRSTTPYKIRVVPFDVQTGAGGDVYTRPSRCARRLSRRPRRRRSRIHRPLRARRDTRRTTRPPAAASASSRVSRRSASTARPARSSSRPTCRRCA